MADRNKYFVFSAVNDIVRQPFVNAKDAFDVFWVFGDFQIHNNRGRVLAGFWGL